MATDATEAADRPEPTDQADAADAVEQPVPGDAADAVDQAVPGDAADAVDQAVPAHPALARYRAMRDFTITSEPSGADPVASTGPGTAATSPARADDPPYRPGGEDGRFVVQFHRATRSHYDVRLEMGGVLVSWAVPKGPSLDPSVKRLAVHVEDHPVDYIDFEGVIPKGQYGAGDVVVWDRGTWTFGGERDPMQAVADGAIHVDLFGEKLTGRFALVRSRRGGDDDGSQWLMIHKDDDAAVEGWDAADHPRSIITGRTNDEVKAEATGKTGAGRSTAATSDGVDGRTGPAAGTGSTRATADGRPGRADPPGPAPDLPTWEAVTDDEWAAFDELGKAGTWELAGQEVKLTNLDKVLFPGGLGGEPLTKRDFVRYHAIVAPSILPYLFDRPLNIQRFPDGVAAQGFWQKAVPKGTPEWVTRWYREAADEDEARWYVVADSVATMVWLANQGSVELHPWTSTCAAPRTPSWAYMDIDPGTEATFDDVIVLARLYRTALEHLGVVGGPKVTGKRGIQIWIPVASPITYDETRDWVETVSRTVGATVPDLVSWEWRTENRKGLTRLDYTQNAGNKTLVAPFSARPAPGAPVSVPITWDEIDDPDLAPDRWTIRTLPERLASAGDPLRELIGMPQVLPTV